MNHSLSLFNTQEWKRAHLSWQKQLLLAKFCLEMSLTLPCCSSSVKRKIDRTGSSTHIFQPGLLMITLSILFLFSNIIDSLFFWWIALTNRNIKCWSRISPKHTWFWPKKYPQYIKPKILHTVDSGMKQILLLGLFRKKLCMLISWKALLWFFFSGKEIFFFFSQQPIWYCIL